MFLKLTNKVQTLDGKLLMQENTVLLPKSIDTLISSNKQTSYKNYSLFKHGSVKKDLLNFISEFNYRVIFADQNKSDSVMRVLKDIYLIPPVLKSLDYFKDYDFYTYRHTLMVFALSTLLSADLINRKNDLIKGVLAGPTHDFGKICVPLNILQKTNPLNQKEKVLLEHHAIAGYILLGYYYKDKSNFSSKVARDHHERRDGSGYPRCIKLRGRLVEIVAVCDVYDALISSRPYRPVSYDNRTALEEITTMAERKRLSWNVVKALIALNRKSKPHFSACKISSEKRGSPPLNNKYGIILKECHISEDVKQQTTLCFYNFRCLSDNKWEMCSIKKLLKKDGLIIRERKIEKYCRYMIYFRNKYICSCPTRYELYKEYQV